MEKEINSHDFLPKRFQFLNIAEGDSGITIAGDDFSIPSEMYPILGTPEIFLYENTEKILDTQVMKIIDGISGGIGKCYSNAEAVVEALHQHGFEAIQYVGWMIYAHTLPVHHSWAIVTGDSQKQPCIIDLTGDYDSLNDYMKYYKDEVPDARERIKNYYQLASHHLNSERMQLGKASKYTLYIGTPCSKDKGIEIYQELLKKYPNHPAHIETDENGLTKLQREVLK